MIITIFWFVVTVLKWVIVLAVALIMFLLIGFIASGGDPKFLEDDFAGNIQRYFKEKEEERLARERRLKNERPKDRTNTCG